MNISPLNIPTNVVDHTIEFLQESGRRNSEGIVLWLGKRRADAIEIVEAYEPVHEAARDYFRIPPESMSALVRHLAETGTFVAAQVHSHPRLAFHSLADDTWAVVRHVGALSLVLPYFSLQTTTTSFVNDSALFSLTKSNEWVEIIEPARTQLLRIHE